MYEVYKGLGLVLVLEICQSVTMQFTQLNELLLGTAIFSLKGIIFLGRNIEIKKVHFIILYYWLRARACVCITAGSLSPYSVPVSSVSLDLA